MKRRKVKVLNKLGLHARPASEFVRCARAFRAEVFVVKGQQRFSGSSILELLTACLDHGSVFTIEVNGPDEGKALARLCELLKEFVKQEE